MSIGLHDGLADIEASPTIEHPSFNNIGTDEIDAGTEKPRQEACLLASLIIRLCAQFGEMELLPAEILGSGPGIVQQVAFQKSGFRDFPKDKSLVDQAFPLSEPLPPEADLSVGIKATPLDPTSTVVVQAVHRKDLVVGDSPFFQCLDGLHQGFRQDLVAVDGEDELVGGQLVGEVF